MKSILSLGVSCLLLLAPSLATAVPTTNSNIIQARAGPPALADTLNLASELFAVQLVGAQTIVENVKSLATNFELSRLAAQGYNATSIKSIFAQAVVSVTGSTDADPLPAPDEVTALVIQYSSWIWIFQAVGALKNDKHRLNLLCHLIDVGASFSIGQNGTLVKDQICNVGNGGELPTVPLPLFPWPEM